MMPSDSPRHYANARDKRYLEARRESFEQLPASAAEIMIVRTPPKLLAACIDAVGGKQQNSKPAGHKAGDVFIRAK